MSTVTIYYSPSEQLRDAERYRALRTEFIRDMQLRKENITEHDFDKQSDQLVTEQDTKELTEFGLQMELFCGASEVAEERRA